jgi:hypothetical protein
VNREALRAILEAVAKGELVAEAALERLSRFPTEDLGFARIDHQRAARIGFPEVVYCEHKTPEQAAEIMVRLASHHPLVLGTRAGAAVEEALRARGIPCTYFAEGRIISIGTAQTPREDGKSVAVVTAGTSDIPVAEEAAVTCELMGLRTTRHFDIGVAGIHRVLEAAPELAQAAVVIVCAGMEGALASVVGGLVSSPVIAVPTSVGYGASFQGLAALLTMLNSCALGVCVVNIDNGFGAGYLASLIASS